MCVSTDYSGKKKYSAPIFSVFKRTFSLECGALGGRLDLVYGRAAPGHVILVEDKHMWPIYYFTGPIRHSVESTVSYSVFHGRKYGKPWTNY
jgi:hypothetical protein